MVSFNKAWINEWLPGLQVSAVSMAEKLTAQGIETEVESTINLDKVLVGEVIEVTKHPQAKQLNICQVDVASNVEPLTIVCGCPSVKQGIKVAVATVGARLPQLLIAKRELRGVVSHGMLCSPSELGLGHDQSLADGIWHLHPDAPVGESLAVWLKLNEANLSFEITPNRGDCLSTLGLARECGYAFDHPLVDEEPLTIDLTTLKSLATPKLDSDACSLFHLLKIDGIDSNRQLPDWLNLRLITAGMSLHGGPVDVLNYVMLETGCPMHAYDASTVSDDFSVAQGQSGRCRLLNEAEVSLSEKTLCVMNAGKPVCVAGYMGSADTACQADTTSIYCEAAHFSSEVVAHACRRYRVHSNAGARYERGVDRNRVHDALQRALQLMMTYLGGKPVAYACAERQVSSQAVVEMAAGDMLKTLGYTVDFQQCMRLWGQTGSQVEISGQSCRLMSPSWRSDLTIKAQFVSEWLRFYPIEHQSEVVEAKRHLSLPQGWTKKQRRLEKIKTILAGLGFSESLNLSFIAEKQVALFSGLESACLLDNPLSDSMAWLRPSLLPGLLEQLLMNQQRGRLNPRLFEVGRVFEVHSDEVHEHDRLSMVITGDVFSQSWLSESKACDFFWIKAMLTQLLALLGLEKRVEWRSCDLPLNGFHPCQVGQFVFEGDAVINCGQLHPKIASDYGFETPVFIVDMAVEPLLDQGDKIKGPKSSVYPKVRRDLSLIVPKDISYDMIKKEVFSLSEVNCLKQVIIFDIYTGQGIDADVIAMGLGMVFQDESATLKEESIIAMLAVIKGHLHKSLGITVRGDAQHGNTD